ncbi:MAG TPA: transcription termination factor NusA [Patescibacteria group bacterium]|nr:transcription termination factor NusA [Patescibacteria group bacterium]
MSSQLEEALKQLQDEKHISREDLIKMVEASLAAAFRRDYGNKLQNIQVEFNPATMGMKIYDVKTVVQASEETPLDPIHEIDLETAQLLKKDATIGEIIKTEVTPPKGVNFGRIAAQTAKQVIIQKLREAERNQQFSDLKSKERTLLSGLVQRIEGDAVLIDLGKSTGVLFPSEQIKNEEYKIGQRLKVMILHVEPSAKGPKITLSRNHPDIIRRLFEQEVPEIFNGIVEIKAVAREAGGRSKVAVVSNQDTIDPIGACVGQKGSRVNTIINELGGNEKVDIIEWSEDPVKFIANALSPAKILNVQIDFEEKVAVVSVLEDQLSLAIGKAGQNVRLAARLTGWKIDIKTEKLDVPAAESVEEVAGPKMGDGEQI